MSKSMLQLAHSIRSENEFDSWIEEISKARIVMLGEATHGTEEFYRLRRLISEQLIEKYGYKFIAVEGDWPDCNKLHRYINQGIGESAEEIMRSFQRWPTWMWANEETAKLIEWMKGKEVGFYGLDVYSLYESLEVIKKYAASVSPTIKETLKQLYSCFEPYDKDEIAYAKSLFKDNAGCESEILTSLRKVLRLRIENSGLSEENLINLKQNSKIIQNAEQYYRAMIYGGANSWNIRDKHMMDTLDNLLYQYGDSAKAIVWAHNTHIGDYHATNMASEGYVNIGGLAREKYGIESVYLVGFGTYQGTVLAGRAWDAIPEIMNLPPASNDSIENQFHEASEILGENEIFIPMTNHETNPYLDQQKGHRAVGVVYQNIYETHKHNYVPTLLSDRYDAFIFVNKTSALRPIKFTEVKPGLLPETWPNGT
jgi:erythromycin esterase